MGVALGLGYARSSGSPEMWFGHRTFLGEGVGVKWKQLAPCLGVRGLIHLL